MKPSELILAVEQLAAWARVSGHKEMERFWTSVVGSLVADTLRHKRAVLLFDLNEASFREHMAHKAAETADDKLDFMFDVVRTTINAVQAKGKLPVERADMLRRVTNEVEAAERRRRAGEEGTT